MHWFGNVNVHRAVRIDIKGTINEFIVLLEES